MSHGAFTVAERHIADGTPWAFNAERADKALDVMTGATTRDRQLADLDDGLRRCAADGGSAADVLERVKRKAPTDEQIHLAGDYVAALCRPHRQSRGENSRAECFYRLALALGIPAESREASPARALAKTVQKARKKLR